VAYGRSIRRGGSDSDYNRLVLPGWRDGLDSSFSQRRGGRWNAPGEFPVLYFNQGERMARVQVLDKLAGQPYGPEDLNPREQHQLLRVTLPEADYLDAVTEDGLGAVGLPTTYPREADGSTVPWARCQPVGRAAWDDGLPGIGCRSAAIGARPEDEELAFFDRAGAPRPTARERIDFDNWFLAPTVSP